MNSREACTPNGFRDRPVRPLRHPSVVNRVASIVSLHGECPVTSLSLMTPCGLEIRVADHKRVTPRIGLACSVTKLQRTLVIAARAGSIVVASNASQGAYFSQSWGWVALAFLVPTTLVLILDSAASSDRLRVAFALFMCALSGWIVLVPAVVAYRSRLGARVRARHRLRGYRARHRDRSASWGRPSSACRCGHRDVRCVRIQPRVPALPGSHLHQR